LYDAFDGAVLSSGGILLVVVTLCRPQMNWFW